MKIHQMLSGDVADRFDLATYVVGHVGADPVYLGEPDKCRFCDAEDKGRFKKIAHTFPEALGNKWVFSRDECDECNSRFGSYDDALAKAVGPLLTIGGTSGKNGVRQTGRTAAGHLIRRERGKRGRIHIQQTVDDLISAVRLDPVKQRFRTDFKVPKETFVPRLAYKALVKMGVALLPTNELHHYRQLIDWLKTPKDQEPFHLLPVGMSFGSVGNAPPNAIGALLRRRNPHDTVPHMVFIFCAGSVCVQIDLMSDQLEEHLPPTPIDTLNIGWQTVLADDDGNDRITITYGEPTYLNWASLEPTLSPVESLEFDVCLRTQSVAITPRLR